MIEDDELIAKRAELARLAHVVPAEFIDALLMDAVRAIKGRGAFWASDLGIAEKPLDVVEIETRAIETAALDAVDHALDAEGPAFEVGPIRLSLPKWGYERTWSLEELDEVAGFDAAAAREKLGGYLRALHASPEAAAYPGQRFDAWQSLSLAIQAAALDVLRRDKVLRGPCPRCRRPEWATKYRPPKAHGRPPLEYTFCPLCADEVRLDQQRERIKRHREKSAEQGA